MKPLNILILENSRSDAAMIQRLVIKKGMHCHFNTVTDKQSFLEALKTFLPDVILSDNSIPQFNADEALQITRQQAGNIPFILVTGSVSEEFAAGIIREGADDFILKDRMARLPAAIEMALERRKSGREKQETARRLKQGEENYRSIMERISDGFVALDKDWNYTYVNKKAGEILNRKPEDLIGKNVRNEFPEPTGRHFFENYRQAMATQQYVYLEEYYDALQSWLESHIYPSPDGLSIFFRNSTGRKLAEQQKEFDRNNLYSLINNTLDLMWSVDLNYRLITSNHAFDNMVEHMSGKKPFKGSDVLSEGFSKQQLQRYKTYYDRAFAGETFTETEHSRIPHDLWSEISFNPVIEKGIVIGTACFSRNITTQRKTEEEIITSNERFELVVSATNDIIWDWDLKTDTLWWNKNFYLHFGYAYSVNNPEENSWNANVYPTDKKRVLAGISLAIDKKESYWSDEYRFLKADRSVAFVLDCGYILYNEDGEPYRMVGAMLDITNRKKAEELLQKSLIEKEALAERMSVILNTLPANVALLDNKGFIVDVNDSWRDFAGINCFCGNDYRIGDNFLKASRKPGGKDKPDGRPLANGIKAVLEKKRNEFVFEYPSSTPGVKRWFRMVASPLINKDYSGAVVMHTDISELRRLEEERMESKMEEQTKITEAIFQAQEKERNAIGLELHDNVNQILAGTVLQLSMIKDIPKESMKFVKSSVKYLQNAVEENRKISHALVIPDFKTKSLVDQIFSLSDSMLATLGIEVHINTRYLKQELIDNQQKLAIYRIIQEQCTNITKYAKARSVSISLETIGDLFKMCIADDGQGASQGKTIHGIGLSNINNRLNTLNGVAKITTSPGNGFKLEIRIPLKNPPLQ